MNFYKLLKYVSRWKTSLIFFWKGGRLGQILKKVPKIEYFENDICRETFFYKFIHFYSKTKTYENNIIFWDLIWNRNNKVKTAPKFESRGSKGLVVYFWSFRFHRQILRGGKSWNLFYSSINSIEKIFYLRIN